MAGEAKMLLGVPLDNHTYGATVGATRFDGRLGGGALQIALP